MSEQEIIGITCFLVWMIGYPITIYILGRKGDEFHIACIIATFWPVCIMLPFVFLFEFIHNRGAENSNEQIDHGCD